ncbi:MAG: hypothetical protein RQ715_02615 [Methylococcales bacterium]|nr:hypothetical protein [Methylococcales bacterium]
MTIIDQLRKQAANKQHQLATHKQREQHLADQYQSELLPCMQRVFQFLQELVNHLNFLEHVTKVNNYSSDYPQLGTLIQKDYKINTDGISGLVNLDKLMQINVSYRCVGTGTFRLIREGKLAVDREMAFLYDHKLRFEWKSLAMRENIARTEFMIERYVPVMLRFEVDYENSALKMQIRNHSNFNHYDQLYDSAQINDAFLDKVARYILRQDEALIRLPISEACLQHLRQQLKLTAETDNPELLTPTEPSPQHPAKKLLGKLLPPKN